MVTTKNSRDNYTKENISKNIFKNIGIPKVYSKKIVDDLISLIVNNLYLKKKIKIKNFGSFYVLKKARRIGRNPKDKKKYEISKRIVVNFKASDELKLRINKNV